MTTLLPPPRNDDANLVMPVATGIQ